MDSEKNAALKKYFIYSLLAFIAIATAILSTRSQFRELVSSNQKQSREILAKIFTEFSGQSYVILKIKTETGIDIEIFLKDENNSQKLKQKFSLKEDTEAFLMVNNNSLNLGLNDVDQDGVLDIIAPTVDRNGNSRLNIFKFNADLNQFVPVQPEE
jgi:hypothetical protein